MAGAWYDRPLRGGGRVEAHGLAEAGKSFVVPARFRLHETPIQVGPGIAPSQTDRLGAFGERFPALRGTGTGGGIRNGGGDAQPNRLDGLSGRPGGGPGLRERFPRRGEGITAFLAGSGPLTPTRSHRYSTLAGFFNYTVGRGLAQVAPLPMDEPKPPPYAPAYICSTDERRRLFDAIEPTRKQACQLDAHTLRAVLLTLYGAGLRLGEALRLTREDVDLPEMRELLN